ncbi:MAG: PAS domain-containing protein, partial [Opitutus sp.]
MRLAEAEETLRAIRSGEVDAVVVSGKQGPQVFTLEGAERAYRVLIESMNEGALTLKADQTILYANECFARMIKCPLEQVTGSSFHRFLSADD